MKKNICLAMLLIAFAMVGCQQNTKPITKDTTTKPAVEQASYDLAIMDKGQLILFDIANKSAVPVAEEDSLFNLTFTSDGRVYYSVKEDNNTFVKFVDTNDPDLKPTLANSWNIPYDCCVGTAYYCLKAPVLSYYPEQNILGMHYMQSPNYGYDRFAVFDLNEGVAYDAEDWSGDLAGILYDLDYTDPYADRFACAEDNGDLYYRKGDEMVFLADRLGLGDDSDEDDEFPYYVVLSVDPTNRFVLFQACTYLGEDDEQHGPLCFASLDGEVQKVLGDYDESYPGEWLPDGSLVYGNGNIHLLTPDGKDEELYPGTCFVLRPKE